MKLADILPSPAAWRRLAPLLLLMAAVLLLFRSTAVAMVTIWDRSDTFAHAFLVPPITVWLVWRRRAELALLQPQPAPWVLLPMAAVCGLWFVGELAGVNAATQFALVALLVLSVPAVFGMQVARTLTFPLMFLFFSVPVGEFMVPLMMGWTADFAAAAVRMSGIPLYREGLQFVIPSGTWSVVEACSGVRYLIASFMVGTLFAYLNFQSNKRRVLFMIASLLVPIVANWLRAYMIVMIGHLSDNKLAAGVDHIIYGWVFFGIVIGAMFMVGSRWAEPEPEVPAAPSAAEAARLQAAAAGGSSVWLVGVAALALLGVVQGAMWKLNQPHANAMAEITLPDTVEGGWTRSADAVSHWAPAYYRDQGYDRKMVTSSNNLADPEDSKEWAQTATGRRTLDVPGIGTLPLRTADLRGSPEPGSLNAQRLRVWTVYWIGGHYTTSDVRARLQLAVNRLMGRGDDAATLFFYAPMASVDNAQQAEAALQRFVPAVLPGVQATLVRASGGN